MSFRNRCVILGANGPINLTVPIIGGRDVKLKMSEIRIDNSENWQTRHFRSIVSGYNRSPFFEYFGDSLGSLYMRKYDLLEDWNMDCLTWLIKQMGLILTFEFDRSGIQKPGDSTIVDLRDKFFPKTMMQHKSGLLPYRQVFGDKFGFVPNLSAIDFLFCEGPTRLRANALNTAS